MMGLGGTLETEKPGYWMRWLPYILDLTEGTWEYDSVGMQEAGMLAMLPATLGLAYWFHWTVIMLLVAGAMFWLPYVMARFIPFPTIPKFAQGASWGEVFVGMLVGAGILFTFNIL